MKLVELEKVKRRLDITTNEKGLLLSDILEEKTEEIINFCDKLPKPLPDDFKCPNDLQGVICRLVASDYNKLGSEGLTSESYSGVSQTFENTLCENDMKILKRYRKVLI